MLLLNIQWIKGGQALASPTALFQWLLGEKVFSYTTVCFYLYFSISLLFLEYVCLIISKMHDLFITRYIRIYIVSQSTDFITGCSDILTLTIVALKLGGPVKVMYYCNTKVDSRFVLMSINIL